MYKLYDTENVGFITKNNLKNLPGPMHISDQLFDSLDENNDLSAIMTQNQGATTQAN